MISPCTKTLLLWSYDAAISPESAKQGVPQVLAEQKHLYSALMVPLQISKLPILCAPTPHCIIMDANFWTVY